MIHTTSQVNAVEMMAVCKSFKGVPALVDVDLVVPSAGVFALVGPDGAGKSTLIRTLCGLLVPDSGTVEVLGARLPGGIGKIRPRLGYLSQRFSLYGDLSIDENIAFSAEIYGGQDYRSKRNQLLDMTGLTPFRDRLADKLSGGMRQKLALACTLVHNPDLILLDEPTNGVDPVSRREFWKLLRGLGAQGITLLMSTPYMDEAERADQVALVHEGRILLSGSPRDIRNDWDRSLLEFFCNRNRDAVRVLEGLYPWAETQIFGDRVHLAIESGRLKPHDVATSLKNAGIQVHRWGSVRPGLENIFLSLTREVPADV